ncbi:MAG TPA: DNA polymerase III subunit chi [Desulfovibrio sp.]|nr:DNA polymerase III subunit chi [Desulfovibrio sp.]
MPRQGYSFLVCPDPELLRRRVDALAAGGGMGSAERKVFWGDDAEPLPGAFWEALTQKSLFSTPKTLVLRRAHSLKAEAWDRLDKALSAANSEVWVFLCLEGAWDRGKVPIPAALSKRTLWKHAEKSGWIWQSKGLDDKALRGFVRDWAAAEKIGVEPQVLETLCRALPLDAAALALELDKLALAAGPERRLLAEHAELVQQSEDMDLFALMDALAKGGSPALVWQRVLGNRGESDSLLFPLVGALCREARTLWALLTGDEDVKIHPYVRQLKTPLARRLGKPGLQRLFDLALEADLGVKSGSRKPEQALELLVAELTGVFGAGRAGP